MDASGSPREGWMTFIPMTVLLFIVVYVMGGPSRFVNVVAYWVIDMTTSVANWLKHL
jgi:hypothetical protein